MVPWLHLDTASVPGDGGELRLMSRGAEFSIMAGSIELMNSRRSGSEIALATLACEKIAGNPAPRVLIGGLGMGFTLRAAQAELGKKAQIVVAEIVPAVIAWARGALASLHGDSLADKRVNVRETDVGILIRTEPAGWDAIMLDVDNGPDGLSRKENDRLYDYEGLQALRRALRPGGVVTIWSAAPDPAFFARLRRAGFVIEEVQVRAHRPGKGPRHVVWVAQAKGAG